MASQQTLEKAISRDGTAIGYFRSGAGRPLVLVHGTTADHTRWDTVRDLFEPHLSLATMDRRGRGASSDADAYAFEREVEDVVAVVDALARETGGPVDLLGHSYGGLCSLGAVLQTDNVRRLVIYEAPVLGEGVVPDGFLDQRRAAGGRGALRRGAHGVLPRGRPHARGAAAGLPRAAGVAGALGHRADAGP